MKVLSTKEFGEKLFYREDTNDYNVMKEVLKDRLYQKPSIGFVVNKGEVWLDIGAHIGIFAAFVRQQGGRCICFEPDEANYKVMLRNLGKKDVPVKSAVSCEETGKVRLFASKDPKRTTRPTILDKKKSYKMVGEVNNMNVEEVFGDLEYDGVKMDIEGAELEMIDREIIPLCDKLVFEYHFSIDRNMANFRRRMEILRKHFSIVSYFPSLDSFEDEYPGIFDRFIHCIK